MILSVKDRLVLLLNLPKEDNYLTKMIAKGVRIKIEVQPSEIDSYEFKVENGSYVWNLQKEKEMGDKDFSFTDSEIGLIKQILVKLDSEKKITDDLCGLYETFVLTGK